jgi:predicted oxidoreductase
VLAEVSGLRRRVIIATKCGVRFADEPHSGAPYRYDVSAEHIERSCEGSLRRLRVETIDIYQLHRADWLLDPGEVAAAFDRLHRQGKVRFFGVSNFRPATLAALRNALSLPIVVHQVEISLANLAALDDGTLDQCLAEHITPLAWSPLGGGLLASGASKLLPAQQAYRVAGITALLDTLAAERGISRANLALSWLLKHASKIVPIIGSTDPQRIRDCARAAETDLSREDWYRLTTAARGTPLA